MRLFFLFLVEEKKWNNGKDSLFGFTIVHNTLKKIVKWFSNGKIVNAFFVHILIILLSLNLGGLKFVSLGRKWLTPFSFFFFFFLLNQRIETCIFPPSFFTLFLPPSFHTTKQNVKLGLAFSVSLTQWYSFHFFHFWVGINFLCAWNGMSSLFLRWAI